uniref:Reticulon-like protein n=1 Tax=Parastrongyloides trichosuri TaxID=131310 RepID=A0A0N4ZL96_PARTI
MDNQEENHMAYDEMMEKTTEVVNNILSNIPDEYKSESQGKLNDVIEEEKHEKDQFVTKIETLNDDTEDIFVSDPKPTNTHYVTESIISHPINTPSAIEDFVEHISDDIVDKSTDEATKINDHFFNMPSDINNSNILFTDTTNPLFENDTPKKSNDNDNNIFDQSNIQLFNETFNQNDSNYKEGGTIEGYNNILFNNQQDNEMLFNKTNIESTFNNDFNDEVKEEYESNNDYEKINHSPREEYESNNEYEKINHSPKEEKNYDNLVSFSPESDESKESFERVNLQQSMYSPTTINEEESSTSPMMMEDKIKNDSIDITYPETLQQNNDDILFNDTTKVHYDDSESKNNIIEEEEPFKMNSSNEYFTDLSRNEGSDYGRGINTTLDVFNDDFPHHNTSGMDNDFPVETTGESLHSNIDDILGKINAAASATKHSSDAEISPVVEESDGHPSPIPDDGPVIINEEEKVSFEDEDTFQRNGPLTIPQETTDDYKDEPEFIPRPPTPPKDLNDDEYQPEVINLGPPPSSHHFSSSMEPIKPILKSAYHHEKAWVDFKTIKPEVMDILYWRDPKKSGAALGVILISLLLLTKLSLISLFSYASLLILTTTLGFRLFKAVEGRLKTGDNGNPFSEYLTEQFTIPNEKVHAQVDVIIENVQKGVQKLQKLFLIENVCESIKFVIVCWALTYIGGWFTMLGLSFIVVIGAFTLPKVYEVYQEPIDAYLKIANEKIHDVLKQVEGKVPCVAKFLPSCPGTTADVVEEEKKDQ